MPALLFRSFNAATLLLLSIPQFTPFMTPTLAAELHNAPLPSPHAAGLSPEARSQLRYRLENLWNEVHLLVLNQVSEARDVRRQEKEFELLRIFDRIPSEPRIAELKAELNQSASSFGLKLNEIQVRRNQAIPTAPPREVFTDTQTFRFSKNQLTETLQLTLRGPGSSDTARKWVETWPDDLLRFVEVAAPVRATGEGWVVEARAFRFRKVNFPKLKPRDPMELLPSWARRDPSYFAKTEPQLWDFVKRIQEWTPKTLSAYEQRRKFFLNDAKMSFFLAQSRSVLPAPNKGNTRQSQNSFLNRGFAAQHFGR